MSIERTNPEISPRVLTPGGGISFWLVLLTACNITLPWGKPSIHLALFPDAVFSGQWWRLCTFPLAHVSLYHLVLDGAAFLLLWRGIEEKSLRLRAVYLAGCWTGSLILPLIASELIAGYGLCGLSGICHGLLGVTALEMVAHLREKSERLLGAALLAGLTGKCLWELMTGEVILASFHPGSVGTPIVETHVGGLIGGVTAFCLLRLLQRRKDPLKNEDKE